MQYVVHAVNSFAEFNIPYLDCHIKQQLIANGFKNVSEVELKNCAGAIDGLLIWILKPSLKEVKLVGVDQEKFFCSIVWFPQKSKEAEAEEEEMRETATLRVHSKDGKKSKMVCWMNFDAIVFSVFDPKVNLKNEKKN